MAFQLSYTDSATQAVYPTAFAQIVGIGLHQLHTGGGVIIVSVFPNSTAAQSATAPLARWQFKLVDAEATTLSNGMMTLLYTILANRPEFATAVQVADVTLPAGQQVQGVQS